MIYAIGILAGVLNGLFSSGGGQILLLYFIYLKKQEDKKIRGTILTVMVCLSIITLAIYYIKGTKLQFNLSLVGIIIAAVIGGSLGQKLMKKVDIFYLNIMTGLILLIISTKQLFFT